MKKLIKNQRGASHILLLLLVVGAFLVVGFIVFEAYVKVQADKKGLYNNGQDIQGVVASIKTDVSVNFPDFSSLDRAEEASHGIVSYRVDGYEYVVSAESTQANTVVSFLNSTAADDFSEQTSKSTELANYIDGLLQAEEYKFQKDPNAPYPNDPDVTGYTEQYYASDNSICTVNSSSGVSLNCVLKSEFKPTAEEIAPLATAYKSAEQKPGLAEYSFTKPEITESKTPGYKKAFMGIGFAQGGFVGLFYEKDGQWQYFAGGQGNIACSLYEENPDARLAYLGTDCWRGDSDSTVQ